MGLRQVHAKPQPLDFIRWLPALTCTFWQVPSGSIRSKTRPKRPAAALLAFFIYRHAAAATGLQLLAVRSQPDRLPPGGGNSLRVYLGGGVALCLCV